MISLGTRRKGRSAPFGWAQQHRRASGSSALNPANALWNVALGLAAPLLNRELFADLFEDWMRGEKKVSWDHSEPTSLNLSRVHDDPLVKIALLPVVSSEDVRAETYALFAAGMRSAIALSPVRSDLFGINTDEIIGHFRDGLVTVRH